MSKTKSIIVAVVLLMAPGCASRPPVGPERPGPPATAIDCTDVPGRRADIPPTGTNREIYHPDVMEDWLRREEKLRDIYGKHTVTGCAEARRFSDAYRQWMGYD